MLLGGDAPFPPGGSPVPNIEVCVCVMCVASLGDMLRGCVVGGGQPRLGVYLQRLIYPTF